MARTMMYFTVLVCPFSLSVYLHLWLTGLKALLTKLSPFYNLSKCSEEKQNKEMTMCFFLLLLLLSPIQNQMRQERSEAAREERTALNKSGQ